MAVASYVALLGHARGHYALCDAGGTGGACRVERVSRAPGAMRPSNSVNGKLLRVLPHAAVAERLAALGTVAIAAFWEAVRDNTASWCSPTSTPGLVEVVKRGR